MTTALKLQSGRQTPIVAYIDVALANLASGVDLPVAELPAGASLLSGDIVVTEAFNSGTSDVLSVGDPTTYNRYISAQTVAAAGRTALVPTGYVYTAPTKVSVRLVSVGTAATTGKVRVRLSYIVDKRSQFNQGLGV
jgi:hypothetical protein